MAEFPSMPLWIGDLLGDKNVMVMGGEDVGAYMLLLFFAWQNEGEIPNDQPTLMRIARVDVANWQRVWGKVKPCWELNDRSTAFTHGRVKDELLRLREAVEQRRRAGIASAKSRKHRMIKQGSGRSTSVPTDGQRTGYGYGDGSGEGSKNGKEGGSTYEKPPARPRPEPTVEAEPQPAKAKQWVDAILSAYRRHGPPSAVEVERVRAHVAELVDCGKPQDKFDDLCDWCENSSSLYRPKDPASATDPSKWTKWQQSIEDELEDQKHKKGRR